MPSHLHTDELKVPFQTQTIKMSSHGLASSPYSSKGSHFHLLLVSVQTSREFCAAPKSLPPPDDESSPPGPKPVSIHPTDIILKQMGLYCKYK